MRVSTNWLYQNSVDLMLRNQVSLAKTQEQIGSGKRINSPSDDPIGFARVTEMQRNQLEIDQWNRNTLTAQNRLTLSEGSLAEASKVLQRLRELSVQGNNGVLNSETRANLVAEVTQLSDQLVQIANIRDADGQYLFAGTTNGSAPFMREGGAVSYLGDNQTRFLPIGPASRIADSETGQRVFMSIPSGNGVYSATVDAGNTGSGVISLGPAGQGAIQGITLEFGPGGTWDALDDTNTVIASGTHAPGDTITVGGMRVKIDGTPAAGDRFAVQQTEMRSMFNVVDRMAAALGGFSDAPEQRAQFHSEMNSVMADLEQSLGSIIDARSRVGARLVAIETQAEMNADTSVQLERYMSEIRDVDYASSISKMNQQMVALQAAQQSFLRVTSLSLFNYL